MKKLITAILACLLAACTVVGCAKIDNEAGNSSTVTGVFRFITRQIAQKVTHYTIFIVF